MKRRQFIIGAAGLFGTGLLVTACGSSTTPAPGAAAAQKPTAKPTGDIKFWSALAGMEDVTKAFNASQSDITVTFETIPNGVNGGYAKLATAITAGDGPDVSTVEYPQLPQFVSNGHLIPLNDLIDTGATVDKLSAQIRGQVEFGDKIYGLPYDAAPQIFWVRKDLLDEAGATVPKTWDEFEEVGNKLKAINPDRYLASFNPNEVPITAALAWQGGGKWFTVKDDKWKIGINDAATMKVADFWQKMIDAKIVKVQQAASDEWGMDLAQGNVAGVMGASWSARSLQKRVENADQKGAWIAAEMPTWGSPAGAFYGGSSFNVTKGSKNPEAAAAFITYLTTDPKAIEARGNGGAAVIAFPGLTSVAQKAFDSSFFGNDIYEVFDAAYKTITPGWQWGPNWEITKTAIGDAYGKLTTGGTVGEAITAAQAATVAGLKQTGLSVSE